MTDPSEIYLESVRLQLQEALVTFRLQTSMMVQAFGFLVAADALLLGYGFSQKEAGILLIAGFMPLALLFVYIEVARHAVPVAYVAIRLERLLLPGEMTLAATYCATRIRPVFSAIESIPDTVRADDLVSAFKMSPLFWLKARPSLALYCAAIAQFGLFLAGLVAFNYRFM
jgi:hypothetical protein